jgi:hypothetical protein
VRPPSWMPALYRQPVFDRRKVSCPRRQNLARLGGDELLRPQCAAGTTGHSEHISRSFLQSIRDITPEFSGRTMKPKGTVAVPEVEMTVTPVHFIVTGPAATRCYIAARTTPHRRRTPIAWRSVRSASRRINESPFHVHGPIMRPQRQRRNNAEASWHERHEGAECHNTRCGHGRYQASWQRPCRAAEATPSCNCACLGVFKPGRYNARVQRPGAEVQAHKR